MKSCEALLIIKDDSRYDYTEKYLTNKGFVIDKTFSDKIKFILFAFRSEPDKNIYNENFFSSLDKNIYLFSGIENKFIKENAKKYNLKYDPLMESNYVATLNSIPTAEGIICYLIQNRKKTIMDSKILVIGYGRCGSVLAEKLFCLGAKVFVHTRSKSSYTRAITNKIKPFYKLDFNNLDFDVIINTAPAKIIDDKNLSEIDNRTLMLDITRDGFNIDLVRKKNPNSDRLLGIPAKFAQQTAGEILGKYIYEKVSSCYEIKK